MVDVGISYKNLTTKLNEKNIDLSKIDVLFITHDHIDHVKGLDILSKNNPHITIYILESTFHTIKKKYLTKDDVTFLKYYDTIEIDSGNIEIIETSHDSNGSYALVMNKENFKFIHMTDTGYISESNLTKMRDCSGLLIESNYDDLLIIDNKRYPYMTKKRIMSNTGHLSNKQCSDYLEQIVTLNTKLILYAHLSENNNTPNHVAQTHEKFNLKQIILHPNEVVEILNVDEL